MFLAVAEDDKNLIFSAVALLITLMFTIILGLKIRKEKLRYREERSIVLEGLLSKTAITSAINAYLAKITPEITFSLLYIDIDNFQEIIDAFGKKEAEKSLEKVAYFVTQSLPKRVLMANYNGTQFLIFMKNDFDRLQVLEFARKVLDIIKRPFKIYKDTNISFSGSIGICFYPKHGQKFKQLMNSAQIALHNAKRNGGNNYVVYSSEMIDLKGESVEYHLDIKDAIEKKEFVLYYQPIININDNSFYGAEALVRWNHPKHGVLTPNSFLHIMEQSGDINWIGTWGLETLIKEYYELQKDFPYTDFKYTFNLSPKQLMSDSIVEDFNKIIKKYKMPANNISLEIAEFSVYERNSMVKQNLARFSKVGFKIAINGYGLDYSTLSTLDKLPIDVIKLDKQFFEREKDSYMKDKLADLIVDFAKNNKKLIISEGIENQAMLEIVKKLNIDLVQGYLYSKPILSTELGEYLKYEGWKQKINQKEEKVI